MKKVISNLCASAHEGEGIPSCPREPRAFASVHKLGLVALAVAAACGIWVSGCDSTPTKPAEVAKPAEPAIPDEMQEAARAILGREVQVLAYGDLAKTGKPQLLAANVVPKTPQNQIPGMVVTRAVVLEKNEGKWAEILRADEHLKNAAGYLALSPRDAIGGWRLQWEQNDEKGLQLYFTPVKGNSDPHVLPVGVRWNPEKKRYQSMDRSYEHFLMESPSLGEVRSTIR
jgi:beta-glucosidase-like glycosyl hydrolase